MLTRPPCQTRDRREAVRAPRWPCCVPLGLPHRPHVRPWRASNKTVRTSSFADGRAFAAVHRARGLRGHPCRTWGGGRPVDSGLPRWRGRGPAPVGVPGSAPSAGVFSSGGVYGRVQPTAEVDGASPAGYFSIGSGRLAESAASSRQSFTARSGRRGTPRQWRCRLVGRSGHVPLAR
jgi:hypothetical protein